LDVKDGLAKRKEFPDSTLSELYDPLTMPGPLAKAHQLLDKSVDSAYGKSTFASDAQRVAFLFELYRQFTASLNVAAKKTRKAAKKNSRR
jgi:hypothetical protein